MIERMGKRRGEAGFTLIELLVVIVILGILAAVVVFAVSGVGDKGKASAFAIDARTIRTAQEALCAQTGHYGTAAELVAAGLLTDKPTYHELVLSGGGPCGKSTASGFNLSCDAALEGCGAGGTTSIQSLESPDVGLQNVTWGIHVASAGTPGPLGGNVQGGDLDGDGVNDFFASENFGTVLGQTALDKETGRVFAVSGKTRSVLYSIESPQPQSTASFGSGSGGGVISVIGDVDGDAKPDIAIGPSKFKVLAQATPGCPAPENPNPDPAFPEPNGCNEVQGRVWVFSGAVTPPGPSRLIRTLDTPNPQTGAGFGKRLGRAGDVTGDGVPELIVGAPQEDVCTTPACTAAVVAAQGTAGTQASEGNLSCFDAGNPAGCRRDQGRAYVFDVRPGGPPAPVRTIDLPPGATYFTTSNNCTSSCGSFGNSVQGPGDLNGDGITDQLVGAEQLGVFTGVGTGCGKAEPNGCNETQGRMFLYNGADGALLATIDDPVPVIGAQFGFQNAAPLSPGDVNGDGVPDLYGHGFNQPGPTNDYEGGGWIFDGAKVVQQGNGMNAVVTTVNDPTPTNHAQFGWTLSTTDYDGDGSPDVYMGSVPHHGMVIPDTSGGSAVLRGRDGAVLKVFDLPSSQAQAGNFPGNGGSLLGWGLAAPGDLNGDGRPDYVAGAPRQDIGPAIDRGRVFVFLSGT